MTNLSIAEACLMPERSPRCHSKRLHEDSILGRTSASLKKRERKAMGRIKQIYGISKRVIEKKKIMPSGPKGGDRLAC